MSTRTLALSTSVLAAGLLAAPGIASAQTCDPSRLMIILDQSSSMTRNSIGNSTLWEIAVDAVDSVTSGFQDKLQMGLMKFPTDGAGAGECTPGSVYVDTALNSKSSIMSELSVAPPYSGHYTPMYQTLNIAEGVPSLNQNDVPNYVVLVTDGWQWCSYDDDPADRTKPVYEVADLKAKGITTYVVGFGASVDTQTLNHMAVEGGTAVSGCDPTNTDPAAPDNCYYQADDYAELEAAFDVIATNASAEECDGLDNDCDGKVDENLVRNCSTDCGSGTEVCDFDAPNGPWVGCDAPQPEPEVCDDEDNDCDGTVDPGCACLPGDSRECGEESDVGVCQPGVQTCSDDGQWGDCEGSVGPGDEACNNEDDDCDGYTDEATVDGETPVSICGPGFECNAGNCEPVDPTVPPEDQGEDDGEIPALDDGATAAGCGCDTTPGRGGLATGLFLVLGVALTLRRRRERA